MKCDYCEKDGDWLCDYVVVFSRTGENKTCDRPLCDHHRVNMGSGVICSRGRGNGCGCHPLSIDYCPHHSNRVNLIGEMR